MRNLLLAVFLAGPAFAAEAPPAADVRQGTTTLRISAHRSEPFSPWATTFGMDRRGRRFEMLYRIRWDEKDLLDAPQTVGEGFINPGRTLEWGTWGVLQSARLDLFGAHLRPFYGLAPPGPMLASAPAGVSGKPAPRADGQGQGLKPRRAVEMAIDDLGEGAQRELRRWAIRQTFDAALPHARNTPYWQKDGAASSLMEAGDSWQADWSD